MTTPPPIPDGPAGAGEGAPPVMQLLELIEDLTDRIEMLEADAPAADGAAKREGAELDPAELPAWVAWLVATYRLEETVGDKWQRVPGVPQELAALRAAWHTAYDAEGNPYTEFGAVQWHDALARVLARIKDPWYRAERDR